MWSQMFKTIVYYNVKRGVFEKFDTEYLGNIIYFFKDTKVDDWRIERVNVLSFYSMLFCLY